MSDYHKVTKRTEDHKENLEDALSYEIIGAAIEVHRVLGPGLLESAYETCLCRELTIRGIPFERQHPLAISYKGATVDCAYRVDILVASLVIVELKAVEKVDAVHEAQLLTYMKLSARGLGLLLNFHAPKMIDGIKRMVL